MINKLFTSNVPYNRIDIYIYYPPSPWMAVHSEPCDNKSVPTRCTEYEGDTMWFRHDRGTMLTLTDNHITYVIYYSLSRCLPRASRDTLKQTAAQLLSTAKAYQILPAIHQAGSMDDRSAPGCVSKSSGARHMGTRRLNDIPSCSRVRREQGKTKKGGGGRRPGSNQSGQDTVRCAACRKNHTCRAYSFRLGATSTVQGR